MNQRRYSENGKMQSSFLHVMLCDDLLYNPTSVIKMFQMVTEIKARNEVKILIRG